jgi:hypothetical protein
MNYRSGSLTQRFPVEVRLVTEAFGVRIEPAYKDYYQKLGKLGKKIQKKILAFFGPGHRLRICWAFCAALVWGCHSELSDRLQGGQVHSWHGLQGRWAGAVTPAEGTCGPATEGLMTIGPRGFAFDPFQSTAVISGDVTDDGHLSGKLVRQGPDRRDLAIAFDGMATARDAIDGTLQSGRCRWRVTLHRG